jgi:hypothetical protein
LRALGTKRFSRGIAHRRNPYDGHPELCGKSVGVRLLIRGACADHEHDQRNDRQAKVNLDIAISTLALIGRLTTKWSTEPSQDSAKLTLVG